MRIKGALTHRGRSANLKSATWKVSEKEYRSKQTSHFFFLQLFLKVQHIMKQRKKLLIICRCYVPTPLRGFRFSTVRAERRCVSPRLQFPACCSPASLCPSHTHSSAHTPSPASTAWTWGSRTVTRGDSHTCLTAHTHTHVETEKWCKNPSYRIKSSIWTHSAAF